MKDTNKSIGFQKSVESSDMIDSEVNIQAMQCLELSSNTGMCYKNVGLCEDNNFVIYMIIALWI